MKPVLAWLALGFLVLAGTFWQSIGRAYEFQALPTPGPTSSPASTEKQLAWESLEGPYERVAYALALVRAGSSMTLYAGTWGHGLYRSSDRGNTWSNVKDKPSLIKTLAVLPSSNQVLYAGSYKEGLYQSNDGGAQWKQLGYTGDIAFVSSNPDHPNRSNYFVESLLVFADQGQEKILVGTHNGVWASGALSNTWTQLKSGFEDTDAAYEVQALARDPLGGLYAGTSAGLYTSLNGGEGWTFVGPPQDAPSGAREILALAVVTNTTNPTGTLFVGTRGAGIYTLEVASGVWPTRAITLPGDSRAQTIQALLSAPGGVIYAGTVDHGVFESSDSGQTWRQRVTGLPGGSRSILALARDPVDGTLYAGTYGDGVYRLGPGSEEWEPAKGKPPNQELPVDFPVQKMVFVGSEAHLLLAGLQVGGLYSNTNRQGTTPTWARLPTALPIGEARNVSGLVTGDVDRKTIIASTGTGIFRSTDAGVTWRHLTSTHGLPAEDMPAVGLAQGRQKDILYAAMVLAQGRTSINYFYRSNDGGATWKSALGNLTQTLSSQVTCLAVGPDDSTVFVAQQRGQVSVTRDAGKTWKPLAPISNTAILELGWSQRSGWDVFLFGGQQRMLYARTANGLYVSYDLGESWQLRMRGAYTALLTDPDRPHIVYAASPASALILGVASSVKLTPDLWISYDGGETWRWAGSVRDSITTLALDPAHRDELYAGTESNGVLHAPLPPVPTRPLTTQAEIFRAALVILAVAALVVCLYIVATGLSLGRACGVPARAWPELARLRVRHSDEASQVYSSRTRLAALERIVLALAPKGGFNTETLRQRLESADVSTTFNKIESALNSLLDYGLLRRAGGDYQLKWPLLGQIARVRFWETATERTELVQEIRSESDLRTNTRAFFEQMEFQVSSWGLGLRVTSKWTEYALLGADKGIYVHLHAGPTVNADHIQQVRSSAGQAYEEQLKGRIAILIVSGALDEGACQAVVSLRRQEDFRIVLLSHNGLRQATDPVTAQQVFKQSLRRALGNQDLFQVTASPLDALDFFGRERELDELAQACRTEKVIRVIGMPGVGKTSLVHRLLDQWPKAVVAWAGPTPNLYADIRQRWSVDARIKFPQWEPPHLEQPAPEQIQADLIALSASLASYDAGANLVIVLDGLEDESEWETMRALEQAIRQVEGIRMIEISNTWPQSADSIPVWPLLPFKETNCARLISSLALQMELTLDVAGVRLARDSGGHPLILRQLASLAVGQAKGGVEPVTAEHVERAVAQYASRHVATLEKLWKSLAEGEQQIVRFVLDTQSLPLGDLPERLEKLGWLTQVSGKWQVFSPVVEQWVKARE